MGIVANMRAWISLPGLVAAVLTIRWAIVFVRHKDYFAVKLKFASLTTITRPKVEIFFQETHPWCSSSHVCSMTQRVWSSGNSLGFERLGLEHDESFTQHTCNNFHLSLILFYNNNCSLSLVSYGSFVVYKNRPLGLDDFICKEVWRNNRKQRKIIAKEKEIARFPVLLYFLYDKLHSLSWYTGGQRKKKVTWESQRKEAKRKTWIGKSGLYPILYVSHVLWRSF